MLDELSFIASAIVYFYREVRTTENLDGLCPDVPIQIDLSAPELCLDSY